MTVTDVLKQSKDFADELVKQLSDTNTELNKKQVYFMDNHQKIQTCLKALQDIVDSVTGKEEACDDEDLKALNDASAIMSVLRGAIAGFQQKLMITENVQESDLVSTPPLTTENIKAAAQDNQTTQSIVKDMNDIVNPQTPVYSHCLVCDGTIHMFTANSKDELNKSINDIATKGNYSDIQLFTISFSPVPIKKKTILTV